MYLLIWNGTVHSYGDAGKKDGIVHAGGDDHGSRADENVMPFGMCQSMANPAVAAATAAAFGVLTPMPCIPVIPAPWSPGSPTVLVGNTPALNQSSKAICAYGGVIQITNPGTTNIQIP